MPAKSVSIFCCKTNFRPSVFVFKYFQHFIVLQVLNKGQNLQNTDAHVITNLSWVKIGYLCKLLVCLGRQGSLFDFMYLKVSKVIQFKKISIQVFSFGKRSVLSFQFFGYLLISLMVFTLLNNTFFVKILSHRKKLLSFLFLLLKYILFNK